MNSKHPPGAYALFFEAWGCLALARLILLFRPFKTISQRLANDRAVRPPASEAALRSVSIAIARGCRFSPWRTKCFEQALAARMMLRRRNIPCALFLGVRKRDGGLEAHAWTRSGDRIVTGGTETESYAVIFSSEKKM